MRKAVLVVGLARAALWGCGGVGHPAPSNSTPNIPFVIMDDVGIDQMEVFGYGGDTPPSTPTIATLAGAGIEHRRVRQ